jgi:hypothetical protein
VLCLVLVGDVALAFAPDLTALTFWMLSYLVAVLQAKGIDGSYTGKA